MPRAPVAFTLALLACVPVTKPARAQLLLNFFLEGTAGVGVTSGIHQFPTTDYFGRRYFDRQSVAGPVVDLSISPGVGGENFGLGVSFDGMLMQSFWKTSNGSTALQASASAVLFWRMDKSGFYGNVAFGKAWGGETTCDSVADFNGAGSSDECSDDMSGPRFAMGLGYMWPNGLGVRTTGSYAYLSEGDASYRPLTMIVQGTLSSW